MPTAPVPPNRPDRLDTVWSLVLREIEPKGTRTILRQAGTLLALDRYSARIGIASAPLFKMAKARIKDIEDAFRVVSGGNEIVVSLEVLPDSGPGIPGGPVPENPLEEVAFMVSLVCPWMTPDACRNRARVLENSWLARASHYPPLEEIER